LQFLEDDIYYLAFKTLGMTYGLVNLSPKAIVQLQNSGTVTEYCEFDTAQVDRTAGQILWMTTNNFYKNKWSKTSVESVRLGELKKRLENGCVLLLTRSPLSIPQKVQYVNVLESMRKSISFYNLKNDIQPAQISPWSYKSIACTKSTGKSAFHDWVKERIDIWNGYSDLYLLKQHRDLNSFLKTRFNFTLGDDTSLMIPFKDFSGSGIIYSCHPGITHHTLISIRIIRSFGCVLPIELWHYNELSPLHIKYLVGADKGISVHNLATVSSATFSAGDDDHKLYQVKSGALL
jgi:hypothetical protein